MISLSQRPQAQISLAFALHFQSTSILSKNKVAPIGGGNDVQTTSNSDPSRSIFHAKEIRFNFHSAVG